jgi:type IV pilus assembly protein PilW
MMIRMRKGRQQASEGFTLVEVLIAMLIGGVVLAAVMVSFQSQHKVYLAQDEVVTMHQNARVALDMLVRDIRMAGYDPSSQSGDFTFVDDVSFSSGGGVTTQVFTNASQMAFRSDLNGNGTVDLVVQDTNDDGTTDMSDMEQIAFRLTGTTLQRYSTITGFIYWQALVEDIQEVEFLYILEDGTEVTTPSAAQLPLIRSVQVSILARTAVDDPDYTDTKSYTPASGTVTWGPFNDRRRRQLLMQTVQYRNIGL